MQKPEKRGLPGKAKNRLCRAGRPAFQAELFTGPDQMGLSYRRQKRGLPGREGESPRVISNSDHITIPTGYKTRFIRCSDDYAYPKQCGKRRLSVANSARRRSSVANPGSAGLSI